MAGHGLNPEDLDQPENLEASARLRQVPVGGTNGTSLKRRYPQSAKEESVADSSLMTRHTTRSRETLPRRGENFKRSRRGRNAA